MAKMHKSVTEDRIVAAVERGHGGEYPGICIGCGEDADGCEPDARKYNCEGCGAKAVYGAEELLLMTVG